MEAWETGQETEIDSLAESGNLADQSSEQLKGDFIGSFMEYTDGLLSPQIFRLWSGIALVAGALERRVFAKTRQGPVFPNLYTLLVAPPAVGKFIIEEVRGLWGETCEPGTKIPAFKIAPDNMTNASLMDNIAKAKSFRITKEGNLTYHSLLVPAEEFAVLLPAYDMQYIGSLNSIYNNKALHEESRRTGAVRELSIINPQLNILGGVQPSFLASVLPEDVWNTGIARRIIMVYSSETMIQDIFAEVVAPEGLREKLVSQLGKFSGLMGQMKWEQAAQQKLGSWHTGGQQPVPTHSKLEHYQRARTLHLIKLSIISSCSRQAGLVIREIDVTRAMQWLFSAERVMPDIFRAMVGKSDTEVIEEMHYFAMSLWVQKKRPEGGIPGSSLVLFLSQRVPSDKVDRILQIAARANVIARVGGTADFWLPRPKHEHGVE